jgi:hypothetical protein
MIKLLSLFVLLIPAFCYSQGVVHVTSVTLDNKTVTATVLSPLQLKATVAPANATDATVKWTSSEPDIAFVTTGGSVIGVKPGAATITVTTTDGEMTATCTVTVTAQPTTVEKYRAFFMTTNFVIPLVRFNILNKASQTTSIGNVALFNSVGAGLDLSLGRLIVTKNNSTGDEDLEFSNRIGLQIGVLFAANSSAGTNANVFAPTIGITLLNFQIGAGYELGTTGTGETKFFATVAYGIPLAKLIDGGYWEIARWKRHKKNKEDNSNPEPKVSTHTRIIIN